MTESKDEPAKRETQMTENSMTILKQNKTDQDQHNPGQEQRKNETSQEGRTGKEEKNTSKGTAKASTAQHVSYQHFWPTMMGGENLENTIDGFTPFLFLIASLSSTDLFACYRKKIRKHGGCWHVRSRIRLKRLSLSLR